MSIFKLKASSLKPALEVISALTHTPLLGAVVHSVSYTPFTIHISSGPMK